VSAKAFLGHLSEAGLMAFFFKRAAEHKGTDMNKTTLGAPTPTPTKSKCVLIANSSPQCAQVS
jgi:hypothetical protein